jgi:hypothetical protein
MEEVQLSVRHSIFREDQVLQTALAFLGYLLVIITM